MLRGARKYTRYMRVCAPDLEALLTTHADEWLLVDDDGLADGEAMCGACQVQPSPDNPLSHVFAYVFRRGKERQDLYGQYCPDCSQGLIDSFLMVEET